MTLNTGARAQFASKVETTPGTYEAPDGFWEFTAESLRYTRDPVQSQSIGGGRRLEKPGTRVSFAVSGSTEHELVPQGAARILTAAWGTAAKTGAGPYTYTWAGPQDLSKSTVQIGRPGTGGTVHPFSYTGMLVESGAINITAGQLAGLSLNWLGQNESTAESLASASWAAVTRWTSVQATLTVAGSAYCFDDLTLSWDNGVVSHDVACSTNPGQPDVREENMRRVGGEFSADFADLTVYNLFKNGTTGALVVALDDGTHSLTVTMNVRYDDVGVDVPGMQVLKNAVQFTAEHATSDASAFTAVLVSPDTAA